MRKVYKKRDEDAVSPVIATILMVAITVVLAAVLYVMVMGMSDTDTGTTPTATWEKTEKISPANAKLTYGAFGTNTAPKDVSVIVTMPDDTTMTLKVGGDLASGNTTMTGVTGSIMAYYIDLNWEGNVIGGGDNIIIVGLTQTGVYDIQMFHIPSDATITGGADTFQM